MNAVLDLVKVVYDPGAVFERLREKPSFWRPFIAICVVQLVLGVLQLPYTKAAMAAQFAQMPARAGGGAPDPSKFATIGLLFVPIGLLLLFLISAARSEEHTSELQSQSNLVCRLLLEKKKNKHHLTLNTRHTHTIYTLSTDT